MKNFPIWQWHRNLIAYYSLNDAKSVTVLKPVKELYTNCYKIASLQTIRQTFMQENVNKLLDEEIILTSFSPRKSHVLKAKDEFFPHKKHICVTIKLLL